MADTTQFTIELGVAGAQGVDSAASSVAALEQKLTVVSSAASKAADAVRSGEASYKAAEAAYDRSSKALERVSVAMQTASGPALEKLKARQAEAAAAADKARTAMTSEAQSLDRLKASATAAAKTQDQLKKKLEQEKKAAAEAAAAQKDRGNLRKLAKGLRELGGPLGEEGAGLAKFTHAFEGLEGALGGGGAVLVAIPVLLVAITAAALAGAAAFAAWAVKGADAARTQGLLSQGLVQSVEGGKKLDAKIADLSERVPQSTDDLRQMSAELAKTGLRGDALGNALENAATKAAKAKYGPDWQKQNLSLEKSTQKLHNVLDRLFAKLNVEKVLQGISDLVGLFDKGTASSGALEAVWGDLVQGLVDGVANFLPKIRTAFIQFEILTMKALIAIKPFGSTIVFVGEAVAITAGAIIGLLVGALVLVTGLVAGAIAIFYKLVTALSDAGVAFGKWLASLGSINLTSLGSDMIQGLINGILGAGPAVLNSLKGIVTGAIDSAKSLLGIHSPSTVFAEIGANTAAGMAQGVSDSTGAVQSSIQDMVAPPQAAPSPKDFGGAGGSSKSIGDITINVNGGSGSPQDIGEAVRAALLEVLEGDASQLGSQEAFA